VFGRTPHAEILRVQLERVKQLLLQQDLTLSAVAHQTGFRSGEYLGIAFKREIGLTPGEYRKVDAARRAIIGDLHPGVRTQPRRAGVPTSTLRAFVLVLLLRKLGKGVRRGAAWFAGERDPKFDSWNEGGVDD
jgi:hypothetical protein